MVLRAARGRRQALLRASVAGRSVRFSCVGQLLLTFFSGCISHHTAIHDLTATVLGVLSTLAKEDQPFGSNHYRRRLVQRRGFGSAPRPIDDRGWRPGGAFSHPWRWWRRRGIMGPSCGRATTGRLWGRMRRRRRRWPNWARDAGLYAKADRVRWRALFKLQGASNPPPPVVLLMKDGSAALMVASDASRNLVWLRNPGG